MGARRPADARARAELRGPAGRRRSTTTCCADAIAGELISSEIEIRSGRGEDLQHALKLQREARRRLFALADAHGVALASHRHAPAVGLPRAAHHRHRALPPRPGRPAVRRAAQQHVRAAGARRRPGRRPRDQGLRPAAAGAADAAGDQRELALRRRPRLRPALRPHADVHEVLPALRHPGRLRLLGELAATTSSCCCARTRSSSSPSCGGRCARTTPSGRSRSASATRRPPAPRPTALVELIVACVAQALREVDAGETPPDLPGRLIEENMWRALRYGQDGRLLDLEAPSDRGVPRGRGAGPAEGLDRRRRRPARAQRRPAPAPHDRRRRTRLTKSSSSAWKRPARRTRHRRRSDHEPPENSPKRSSRAIEAEMEQAQGRRRAAADARHADQPRRPQGGPGRRRPARRRPKRDLEQTRQAIDGARALLPLLEARHGAGARRRSRTRCRGCRWRSCSFPAERRPAASSRAPKQPSRRSGPGAVAPGACGFPGQ